MEKRRKTQKTQENVEKCRNVRKNEEILKKAPLWRHLGRPLGTFWSLLGALGVLSGALGALLGRSWRLLGASWASLGRLLDATCKKCKKKLFLRLQLGGQNPAKLAPKS